MKHVKAYLEGKTRVKGVHVLNGLLLNMVLPFPEILDTETKTLNYWGTRLEKWEFTTYRTAAEYVAAVAMDQSAVGVLKFLGDRKNVVEIADTAESVYGFKPALQRRGPLKELSQRRGLNKRQHIPSAVTYFVLTGRISLLGENIDNGRYLDMIPETVSEFFEK